MAAMKSAWADRVESTGQVFLRMPECERKRTQPHVVPFPKPQQTPDQSQSPPSSQSRPAGQFEMSTTYSDGRINVRPKVTKRNVRIALERLGQSLQYNEFTCREETRARSGNVSVLDDDIERRLYFSLEQFNFQPPRGYFSEVLKDIAHETRYHPVREYLTGLVWDGVPRVDTWLVKYGGAADTVYVRAVSALFLIAAVRRVRQPGCKFDELLVLESPQGWDKSSALRALCPHAEWFSDDLPLNAQTQKVIEQTDGKWIIEAADMTGITAAQADHLKAMLSRQEDSSRMAYGHHRKDRPRQFIIAGTTNDSEYLRDVTGNRRFWPVEVQRFDVAGIITARDQLWAEAARREADGESIRLAEPIWQAAAAEQDQRRVQDPWEDVLRRHLDQLWPSGRVARRDLWSLFGIDPDKATTKDGHRLRDAMRAVGWKPNHTVWKNNKAESGFKKL